MPVIPDKQTILNFPHRKSQLSSKHKVAHNLSNTPQVVLQRVELQPTCTSSRERTKKPAHSASKRPTTAVDYYADSECSDDDSSPRKSARMLHKRNTVPAATSPVSSSSVKPLHRGPSRAYKSKAINPDMQLVSPIKLARVTKGRYVTKKNLDKTDIKASEIKTPSSLKISSRTTPNKGSKVCRKSEPYSSSSEQSCLENSMVQCTSRRESSIHKIKESIISPIYKLQNFPVRSNQILSADKLEQKSNLKDKSNAKENINKKHQSSKSTKQKKDDTENKENTPVKQMKFLNVSSPLTRHFMQDLSTNDLSLSGNCGDKLISGKHTHIKIDVNSSAYCATNQSTDDVINPECLPTFDNIPMFERLQTNPKYNVPCQMMEAGSMPVGNSDSVCHVSANKSPYQNVLQAATHCLNYRSPLKEVQSYALNSDQLWHSTRKLDVASPLKREIMSPHKREVMSPRKREVMSPRKREFMSPHKREIMSPHKREIVSPRKREGMSPRKNKVTSPRKSKVMSPCKREVRSPQKCEVMSPYKRQLMSPCRRKLMSPLKLITISFTGDRKSPCKLATKSLTGERKSPCKLETETKSFTGDRKSPRKLESKSFTGDRKSPRKLQSKSFNSDRKSPCKHETKSSTSNRKSPRKHQTKSSTSDTTLQSLASPIRRMSLLGTTINVMPNSEAYSCVRQALSHNIEELVGREEEVGAMTEFLETRLKDKSPGAMYISGAPGTGKTAALKQILATLPCAKTLTPVWVNCMGLRSSNAVYGRIISDLSLPEQPTEAKTLRALEKYFSKKGKPIVLVLDEIDQLESRNHEVLYTLFEWPALERSRLVLLAIANRLDLTERVLPRLSSVGQFAPHRLHFPPYTKQQIVDIITHRLNKCGAPWRTIIRPPALQLLAGKVANVAGDARRAIDVCRRAVDAAQTTAIKNSVQAGETAPTGVVDMASIVGIFNDVYGCRVVSAITAAPASFPIQQKILLCCLLLVQRHGRVKDITMGKLQEVYSRVCSNRQMPSMDASEFCSVCCLLQTRAIIDVGKSKDSRMAKVSLRLNAAEAERALADRELMLQILDDRSALGSLAKKL